MYNREKWKCPDLKLEAESGKGLLVEGTTHEFPECPAAFLRTAADIQELRERRGGYIYAEHLIDGVTHPATIASEDAFEIEAGSRRADSLPNKRRILAYLYLSEKAARENNLMEKRREARSGAQ